MNNIESIFLRYQNRITKRQKGMAALEFALVFPLLFLLTYGMVTYLAIFLIQQSMSLAVQEGARAALRYSADPGAAACAAVNQQTKWLTPTLMDCGSKPVPANCPYSPSVSKCLTVTVTYPYAAKPLMPLLLGMQLLIPAQLTATAVVQLEPTF